MGPGDRPVIVVGGEEYLDSEEAARLLAVKRATLYAYVSRTHRSSLPSPLCMFEKSYTV